MIVQIANRTVALLGCRVFRRSRTLQPLAARLQVSPPGFVRANAASVESARRPGLLTHSTESRESRVRCVFIFVVAAGLNFASTVQAQTTLDPATLGAYGGTYSVDCRNPVAPHLRVLPDTLLMEKGTQRIVGRNPHADRTALGPNPPAGYQMALVSELSNGTHLVFVVFRDQVGFYVSLTGDPNVRTGLGAVAAWQYRRCDLNAGPAGSMPPPAPTNQSATPTRSAVPSPGPSVAAAGQGNVLDADSMTRYGGLYSAACGNDAAIHARVLASELVVEQGAKRFTASNVMAENLYGVTETPDGFLVDLSAQDLTFEVLRDKKGQYLTIASGRELEGIFGKKELARKLRSCDSAQNKPLPTASSPAPATSPTAYSPWALDADPHFKAAFRKAIGSKVKESWVVDGAPQLDERTVDIGGTTYVMASSCKPHDCGDNTLLVLYSKAKRVVYAKMVVANSSRIFGAPPPDVAAQLDRLWTSVFRQNQ